jgi:hypothetical protein
MDKCIFCNSSTSFKFEGRGEYYNKSVCPKCQTEKFGTNFNTGCRDDDCNAKIKSKYDILIRKELFININNE